MPYAFNSSYNYAPFNSDQLAGYMDRGFGLADSVLALRQQEADRAFQLQRAMQNQQLQGLQQQQQQQQAMFPQQQEAAWIANRNAMFNTPSRLAFQQQLAGMGDERRIADLAYQANLPINYMSPSSRAGADLFAALLGSGATMGALGPSQRR